MKYNNNIVFKLNTNAHPNTLNKERYSYHFESVIRDRGKIVKDDKKVRAVWEKKRKWEVCVKMRLWGVSDDDVMRGSTI